MSNQNINSYGGESIQVLKGLEGIRKRPGMYIGDTGKKGLHHLVAEVLDNSVDEAMGGYCDTINVILHSDGKTVTIEDNGRGIPVEKHSQEKKSTLEVVLTMLHAGGKFGGSGYEASGGLHGVGVSCVNALSEKMNVTVYRNDKKDINNYGEHTIELSKGLVKVPVKRVNESKGTNKRGTIVTFTPDPTIFSVLDFDEDSLCRKFRETAFLNAKLTINFESKKTGRKETFMYEGGISDYVKYMNQDRSGIYPQTPFYAEKNGGKVKLFLSFQYSGDDDEVILSFANNIPTIDGGTHLSGFKTALTRVVNQFARSTNALKEKEGNLTGDDIREGITAVISVRLPQPQFEGQTKSKLGTVEVEGIVNSLTGEAITEYFEKNPSVLKTIVERALLAARARAASKKAMETVKRASFLGKAGRMPAKLSDCEVEDAVFSELFIVEGDSAAGSAKGGRDPSIQAVMPIRGKIINPDKNDLAKLLANEEVASLINAIGTGVQDEFDLSKVRYGKIILMTDADDDGCHIRTLLMTFLYRFMKPLIENGYVYLANPPLYRATKGKDVEYLQTDKDLQEYTKRAKDKFKLIRFKGLGEMDAEELGLTTMLKGNRYLTRVTIEDAESASHMLSVLMGANVGPRKEHIIKRSQERTFATEVI